MNDEVGQTWEAELTKKEIGLRVLGRRRELKLSQRELAERVGTSQNRIHLIESGEANITLETLQRLSKVLGLELKIDLADRPHGEEPVRVTRVLHSTARVRAMGTDEEPGSEYEPGIEYSKFAVGTRPYCVWEHDLAERNIEYIESFDSAYFDYVANLYSTALHSDDVDAQHHAAIATRVTYHHALESHFALLFASLQAPDCVVGWMQRYNANSLRVLVRSVDRARHPYLKVKPVPYTWEGIAAEIISAPPNYDGTFARLQDLFGGLWRRLAGEYLDQDRSEEYNNIKHGGRPGTGATDFYVQRGFEETPGEPAPPERMRGLDGSEVGSSFFTARGFGIRPSRPSRSDPHFRVRRNSLSWVPQALSDALVINSLSIRNVLTFLRKANGVDGSTLKWHVPYDEDDFRAPWNRRPGVRVSNVDDVVFEEEIQRFTPEEILSVYEEDRDR
jgi:transcriptional regulator with XRE-family HTH domain